MATTSAHIRGTGATRTVASANMAGDFESLHLVRHRPHLEHDGADSVRLISDEVEGDPECCGSDEGDADDDFADDYIRHHHHEGGFARKMQRMASPWWPLARITICILALAAACIAAIAIISTRSDTNGAEIEEHASSASTRTVLLANGVHARVTYSSPVPKEDIDRAARFIADAETEIRRCVCRVVSVCASVCVVGTWGMCGGVDVCVCVRARVCCACVWVG